MQGYRFVVEVMDGPAHVIFEVSRFLWVAYALLGLVILRLAWTRNGWWVKRLFLLEIVVGAILGSGFIWLPAIGHDIDWDMIGALVLTAIALSVTAATAMLAGGLYWLQRRQRRSAEADPEAEVQ